MQRPRTDSTITRDGNRSKALGSATEDTHLEATAVALRRFISLFLFDVSSVRLSPDVHSCDMRFFSIAIKVLRK